MPHQRLIADNECVYCANEKCDCSETIEQEDFQREKEDAQQEGCFLLDLPTAEDELTCEVGIDMDYSCQGGNFV